MGFANVDSNGNVPHGWSQLIVGALIVYVTGYQVGFGPITWVLIGELFPLHSRARAIGVAVCANFALVPHAVLPCRGRRSIATYQKREVLEAARK